LYPEGGKGLGIDFTDLPVEEGKRGGEKEPGFY